MVEWVYTADLKSAAIKACEFESRPRYQNTMMINPGDIKQGMLVKLGNRGWSSMGIVLQDKLKCSHYNHYAYVYWFENFARTDNPSWAFTETLEKVEK